VQDLGWSRGKSRKVQKQWLMLGLEGAKSGSARNLKLKVNFVIYIADWKATTCI